MGKKKGILFFAKITIPLSQMGSELKQNTFRNVKIVTLLHNS